MMKGIVWVGAAGCLVALLCVGSARSQNEPARGAQPPQAGKPFTPGVDDLMTMLVQPRHQRLYLAGTRKNWELAAFQASELRSSLRRIAEVYPVYLGIDIPQALDAMIVPALKDLDAAIASASPVRFESAFRRVTQSCNDCHVFTEHPFLVVKVPDPNAMSAFADQDFSPRPP